MTPSPSATENAAAVPARSVLITDLARRLGVTPRTLRHYEEVGLITAQRAPHRARIYDDETALVLETIVLLRQADVPISEIHTVMDKRGDPEAFAEAIRKALTAALAVKQQAIRVIEQVLGGLASAPAHPLAMQPAIVDLWPPRQARS